jgi:dihydropteroate synthase
MRKYYTRPCNFYYGVNAKRLIKSKRALPLAGNTNIAFDQLEVFKRVKNRKTTSVLHSLLEIKDIELEKRSIILKDLKTIIS